MFIFLFCLYLKALSADDMIENLLSKKEIFQKKKDTNQQQKSSSKMDPVWLTEGMEPAAYRKVWEQVCTPAGLTDTPKLSLILLGSGLATDTLGYIWSLTNTTVSGALTKIELFRTLALVALAQKGYSFTNLLVLTQFHEAPIPRLDLRPSVPFMTATPTPNQITGGSLPTATSVPLLSIPQVPTVTETLSLFDTLTEPSVPGSLSTSTVTTTPTSAPSLSILSATDLNKLSGPSQSTVPTLSADDDEFDDFKSADTFTAESLTVLDVKDNNASLPADNLRAEDLFKSNFTSFLIQSEKKSNIDDMVPFSSDFDDGKKPVSDSTSISSTDSGSKKDSSIFSTSSLQEALREDLTLAPVTLPCVAPPIPCAPVEGDRYSAIRQLAAGNDNLAESSQEDFYDDFGDFITATQPAVQDSSATFNISNTGVQSSSLASDLQEKCLEACVLVLREANDLFKTIDDPKVLAEVVDDDRGKKYLEEIIEVERIGRRIISSKTKIQADDCELSKQLESLCKSLEPFTKPLEHTHMEEESGAKCGLCQCEIGPAHVKYGINQFHAPCANLFLHITGELLPLTPVT
ncbi:hypothetical protein O3M35_010691 [Rhynocoris fuscipes]|uniref:EH domain-containing protein n=1 Tax=Rhynocoris fuscipes TaxID=488301 RepID=A0AAW1CZY5_9HEMI